MDIERALEHALDGNAVLFVGSGFSREARNLRHARLKTSPELAQYFAKLAAIDLDSSLEDAAEGLLEKLGHETLVSELQQEFSAAEVSSAQKRLAHIPWSRIYTTNYDNVLETAYQQHSRQLTAVTLSDNVRDVPKHETLCIHFNGYVGRLTVSAVRTEIKLTETSYLTASVAESPWAIQFRQDLETARAVFFVGYSLSDLDIKRVLFESETLKAKCFFALGKKLNIATRRHASRFGAVLDMGVGELATEAERKSCEYVPAKDIGLVGHCFQKLARPTPGKFTDRYVFDLLLYGQIKSEFVWETRHGGPHYYRSRSTCDILLTYLEHGGRIAVVHSELGNGKSMVLEGTKYLLLDKHEDVYSLITRRDGVIAEMDQIFRSSPKPFIFIEDYPDWLELIRYFSSNAPSRAALVLSARNSVHDVMIDALSEIFPKEDISEFSADQLTDEDITWLVEYFDEYGLWGEHAAQSGTRKDNILKRTCRSEFHAILMRLFESPQIVSRFNKILEPLNLRRDHFRSVVAILVLTLLNYTPTLDILIALCGNGVLESSFKRDPAIQELVDFDRSAVRMRSSIAAQAILLKIADPNITVDVLIEIIRAAERASAVSFLYSSLVKTLMRFTSLQRLLPERNRRAATIRYYEAIKNLEVARRNPLFWLQYAIACTVQEDFERAEKYFDTAYSFAEQRGTKLRHLSNRQSLFPVSAVSNYPRWRSEERDGSLSRSSKNNQRANQEGTAPLSF